MARLLTCGFEVGGSVVGVGVPVGEDSACSILRGSPLNTGLNSATKRSGGYSLRVQASAAGNIGYIFSGVTTRTYWARMAVNFSVLPDSGTTAQTISVSVSDLSAGAEILVSSTGVVSLNRISDDALLVTGPTIITGTWHVYEISWNPSTGAVQGWVDGVSFGTSSVPTTSTTTLATCFGYGLVAATVMFMDDWALNDDQGTSQNSRCGENGKIVLLKPISDSSTTGFTAGAGGTTNLFDAVDNTAPAGLASGSATNTSQIKDATSNTTDNYVANLSTYTTAGVAGTVLLVQGICHHGNSTTTSRINGLTVVSNPAVAETTGVTGTTQAGTSPTGWTSLKTAVSYAPSVTLGTSPTLKFRKGTASTDFSMCDFMGLYVEYQGPVTGPVAQVNLTAISEPVQRAAHFLVFRGRIQTSATTILQLALMEGSTNLSGTLQSDPLSTTVSQYSVAIPDAVAASINNYSDLSVQFGGYSSTGETPVIEIEQLYLQTPSAAAGPQIIAPTARATTQATASVTYPPPQQLFPSSDVTITGWTPSSGTSLSAMLSDGSDSTYGYSTV